MRVANWERKNNYFPEGWKESLKGAMLNQLNFTGGDNQWSYDLSKLFAESSAWKAGPLQDYAPSREPFKLFIRYFALYLEYVHSPRPEV